MTRLIAASIAAAILAAAGPDQAFRADASAPAAALMQEAEHAAFSLDHADALAAARRAVAIDPDSSAAHRMMAWILWNQMLFQRGVVSSDYYIGGATKSQHSLPKPSATVEAEFHRELDRAIAIATALVGKNEKDVTAQYDLGAAYGLQASYNASISGSLSAAFGAARHAYDAHEKVLELAPSRIDAGVIVGTYRYLVATFSLPTRVFAYMAGFGGGKERGIGMLETAARRSTSPEDAEFALMLIYTRENRDADALKVLRNLERQFPRNRLLVLEEGATLLRGHQAAEADAVLTAGFARFGEDSRPKAFGERALWLYKRGAVRVALGRQDGEADLRAALGEKPIGWLTGRIHLELGKLADLRKERAAAVKEYQLAETTCRDNGDALCQSEADRLGKKPFVLQPGAPRAPF
jgi:tetratricopeptide (TPR) repeat protein